MKTITRDESLKLLGLFALAAEYYAKSREFEFAMNRALGKEPNDQGQLSDAIYSSDAPKTAEQFYEALGREGFIVSDDIT